MAVVCCRHAYANWKEFENRFTRVGGVIEACPKDIRGSPSVNLMIEPDGTVRFSSSHDQIILPDTYQYIGCSFPQTSVPHLALQGASMSIGKELYRVGVIGHVGVDFVAFWDNEVNSLRLWAVDLNLRLTKSAVTYYLFDFLMDGHQHTSTGSYYVSLNRQGEKHQQAAETKEENHSNDTHTVLHGHDEERSYVAFDHIHHPNLATLQYGSFFNACRLRGIAFDLEDLSGLAFMVVDGLSGGVIGALGVGRSVQDSLKKVVAGLQFMNEQAGVLSLRAPPVNLRSDRSLQVEEDERRSIEYHPAYFTTIYNRAKKIIS